MGVYSIQVFIDVVIFVVVIGNFGIFILGTDHALYFVARLGIQRVDYICGKIVGVIGILAGILSDSFYLCLFSYLYFREFDFQSVNDAEISINCFYGFVGLLN